MNDEIKKISVELENILVKKDILSALKFIPKLKRFQQSYDEIKYLRDFEKAEDLIYETYERVMNLVGTITCPFTDFT
jgi:hypothetical protein